MTKTELGSDSIRNFSSPAGPAWNTTQLRMQVVSARMVNPGQQPNKSLCTWKIRETGVPSGPQGRIEGFHKIAYRLAVFLKMIIYSGL